MKIEKNIAFISDINQALYAVTNALMIEEQMSDKNIKINIILFDISDDDKKKMDNLVKDLNLKSVSLIYVSSNNFELGKSKIEHITNITNARLYLSSLLPDVKNVLYMDNDTVVIGDIDDVFTKLNPEFYYGRPWSLKDGWVKLLKFRRMLKNKWYVNAGVLYLNLEDIRKNKTEEKFIKFLTRRQKTIRFADQDVLNCNLKFKPLPHTWNIARDRWEINEEEISRESNLKIYHFLSTEKQWGIPMETIDRKINAGSLNVEEMHKMIEPQKIWKKYYSKIQNIVE